MTRQYALIESGWVTNVIEAEGVWHEGIDVTERTPQPGIGWAYDEASDTFVEPFVEPVEPDPPEPPVEDRRVTRLAFRGRFTHAELVMLEIAALDNPTAPMVARQQAAAIRVMMKTADTANWIDLSRDDTRAGVQQLEAAGLLAEGRAALILDAEIEPHERPPA